MKRLTLLLLIISHYTFSQQFHWKSITPTTGASFRGLSVVDDSVAWVSGSKGWVGRSTNGGNEWAFVQVKGFEQCDFRSLYAFNSKTAIIANAGAPAIILRTNDGGLNWKVVYKNEDTAAFFDGIDFWNNKEGIIYGDPLKGRMMILRTNDGGITWQELSEFNRPTLADGEASFAASGTSIRCLKNNRVIIATGGKVSRLFISNNKGRKWGWIITPVIQGENSTGVFSIAFLNKNKGIIVGGDYKIDSFNMNHIFYTKKRRQHSYWCAPLVPTRGYRECVEYITDKIIIATGPSGTDISYDGGINWASLSDEKGFHVIRKSRKGKLIIMAGGDGKISLLNFYNLENK